MRSLPIACGILMALHATVLKATPPRESDSGVLGPAYDVLTLELRSVASEFPDYVSLIHYGDSLGGRPLWAMKLHWPGAQPERGAAPAVLATGAVHGKEYLGIEHQLPRKLLQALLADDQGSIKSFMERGGILYWVPVVNPDGYTIHKRQNALGIDLNRTFMLEGQSGDLESQRLMEFLLRQLAADRAKLEVSIDYHCCGSALLRPEQTAGVESGYDHLGKIARRVLGHDLAIGTTHEVLGYQTRGTAKDFFSRRFGGLAFTFEGFQEKGRNSLIQHVSLWQEILAWLNSDNTRRWPQIQKLRRGRSSLVSE